MVRILLATRDKGSLAGLNLGLAKNGVHITWAESGNNGISILAESNFDLMVTDETLGDMTGLEFIRKIVSQKPMINCAAVSSLRPDDFHEASEGLGILMQLPVRPSPKYAKILLGHLNSILNTI